MKKFQPFSIILLMLVLSACGGNTSQTSLQSAPGPQTSNQPNQSAAPNSPAGASASVSFAKDIMPIFENSCINCHGGEQIKAGLDMRTYNTLMAGSFKGTDVVPGNSANSMLVQQIVNGKMPKRGPKLTADQIKLISDWVNAGAMNN